MEIIYDAVSCVRKVDGVMYRVSVAGCCLSGWRPVGDKKCMHVRSTTAQHPKRHPALAAQSARPIAGLALAQPRTRSPVSGTTRTLSCLALPPTHTLLQPDSNTTAVSVNTFHVVANTHQPIMTRPAKDMRFLLGSHKHQHHHHDDA